MHCKNCNINTIETAIYCPTCGEEIIHERITMKKMARELAEDGFGWDNRLMHTFRTVLLNPKKLANEFLTGKQKRYLKPFSYMAIALTVSILLYSIMGEQLANKMNEMYQNIGPSPFMSEKQLDKLYTFTTKYQNFIAFLYIPIYAIGSFLVFRKRYNFAEHMVLNIYIYSTYSLLTSLIMILLVVLDLNAMFIQGIIVFQILLFLYYFTKIWEDNIGKKLLRGFVYLLTMLFISYVIIGGIVMIIMFSL